LKEVSSAASPSLYHKPTNQNRFDMTAERKQKLELTWIGKENWSKLEPRILLEDPEKFFHVMHKVSDSKKSRKWR
jgi:hypothetical protein